MQSPLMAPTPPGFEALRLSKNNHQPGEAEL